MPESPRKKQRTTPREPEGQSVTEGTLYADLHRLANVIPKPRTPHRRASGAGGNSVNRQTPTSVVRTPVTAARTPRGGPATRPISARRAAPTTPHAIRALRERANAARTPGRNRRRSARVQRETPRDLLRDLSRVLASNARPPESQPEFRAVRTRSSALDLPDLEDGPALVAPRLSMPLDDMYDDDSIHEAPPRQSSLPNLPDDVDNGTVQSLEFGRRALSENPPIYGGRVSERFGDLGDLNELEFHGDEYEIDGTFINRRATFGDGQDLEDILDDENTEFGLLSGRRDGARNDLDLGVFGGDDDDADEPTFRFTIPQRMQPLALDDPAEESEDGRLVNGSYLENIEEEDDLEQAEATGGLDLDVDAGQELDAIAWESEPEAGDDADLQAYQEEPSAVDRSLLTHSPERGAQPKSKRQRKELLLSKHGHEYPSFPSAVVKRIASGFAKSQGGSTKINKDTLAALVQTSDWFFEQIGEDLTAYSQHAGRKAIEESDVVALMKRQRQLTSSNTTFSLAQKMLPRELLQQLRMDPLPKLRRQKRKRLAAVEEE